MTTTTPEYWEVDGESLQTYAYNITTWGGARQAPPELRGENRQVPHARGRQWVSKIADERILPLEMWVVGANEDGTVADSALMKFDANWKKLKGLLFRTRKQFALTKRIIHPITGMYVPVTAMAEYAGGLEPQMLGRNGASFTVDLRLADPYFYNDEPELIEFTMGEDVQEFVVLGEDTSFNAEITFNGPLTNPSIVNETDDADPIEVSYTGSISSGDRVVLDVNDFSAVYHPASGSPYKVTGNVSNSGDLYWMRLDTGSCRLVFDADSGSGTADLTYRPGWL